MYQVTLKEIIETGLDVETTLYGGVKMWNPKAEESPIIFYLDNTFTKLSAFSATNSGYYRFLTENWTLSKSIENIRQENIDLEKKNSFIRQQDTAKKEFKDSYFLAKVQSKIFNQGFWNVNWSKTHPTCKVYRQGQGYPKVVLDTATNELAIFRTAKEEVFEGKILNLHFLNRVFESVTI